MLTDADVALARISDYAYMDGVTTLPAGFVPVTQAALGLSLGPTESYANGEYTNSNGAAAVLIGTLNGQMTAILDFRGSVNRQDSINDLQDINRQYTLFTNLIAAFDAWVSKQGIGQVVVTGHSLGGAMDQLYMASHSDTATVSYLGETFGSPGAEITPATDNRITNIQIADDPAIYLGENRAAVGAELQSDPALAAAAIFAGPEVFPGLQPLDVLNSIGDLNTDYVNRGMDISLPDANGNYATVTGIQSALDAGLDEHLIGTYISRIEQVTGDTGDDQVIPNIVPTTVGVQVYRFFDSVDGTHFYTDSVAERDATIAAQPDLVYEGVGLNATLPTDPASVPVFRFFDTENGSHFYTDSTTETAGLQSNATYVYEGIAFYEHATPQPGDAAVYRFFDTQDGSHFYTADSTERATVLATRPDLVSEGIAFYTLSA